MAFLDGDNFCKAFAGALVNMSYHEWLPSRKTTPLCNGPSEGLKILVVFLQAIIKGLLSHGIVFAAFFDKIYCPLKLGPANSRLELTKTFTENWDSKAPSVETLLAYLETTA